MNKKMSKQHIKPCNCETCMKARYWESCVGCSEGHSSFWKTITESEIWKKWEKEQSRRFSLKKLKGCFDVDECRECGWLGKEHWQEFQKFIKSQ